MIFRNVEVPFRSLNAPIAEANSSKKGGSFGNFGFVYQVWYNLVLFSVKVAPQLSAKNVNKTFKSTVNRRGKPFK
jgi:hypothetical protein